MLDRSDQRISYAQQQRLIDNGTALCPRPGLGILVGQRFDWNYHGTVGAAMQCSPSLRAAKEAFLRYPLILQPAYGERARAPQTYVDENGLFIYPLQCFRSPDGNTAREQFEFELRLTITLRAWDLCGNKSVPDPAVHVALEYPEPADTELYRSLPCSTLRFGCRQSYVGARLDFVNKPFRLLRKPHFDRLIEQCDAELRQATEHASYRTKVRWYLCSRFDQDVALGDVAKFLQITPRTLTRRLAEEGASYRQLAHQVRMELAAHHLRRSNLSVDRIAEVTGFSSAMSLHRAIRNWRGAERASDKLRRLAVNAVIALTCLAANPPQLFF